MRARYAYIALLVLVLPLLHGSATAAAEEWERLTAESMRLYEAGRYEEAIRVSREALEAAAETLGPRHQVVGKSMNNLGAMLAGHGDGDEAEEVLTEALSILEESLGKGAPGTSSALNNLAELYAARGDDGRAEKLFLRALAIRREAPGEDNADLATTMKNLASLYAKMDRFHDAEALYQELVEMTGGAAAPDLCNMLITEGNVRREQGRPGEAIASYAKALEAAGRYGVTPPSDPALIQETNAVLSVRAGDLEGAASWYGKALDTLSERNDDESDRARVSRDLARVNVKMKRYGEAIPLYSQALEIQKGYLKSDDHDLGTTAKELAAALSAQAGMFTESGRSEEAVPLLVESIEVREMYVEHGTPSLAIRMNNLAGILTELERFGEAERYYSRALEMLRESRGEKDPDYLLVLGNLKQMHALSGQSAKSAADVLRRFFSLLHGEQYAEAAKLYCGSYSFLLEGCCSDADPDDVVYLWHEGCGRCGLQCLEVREIVDWSPLPDGGYRFDVKFSTDEGDLYISGPCCGATAEQDPPDSVFWFSVLRTDAGWQVGGLPLYVP